MRTVKYHTFTAQIPHQRMVANPKQTDIWEYIYTYHCNLIPKHTKTRIDWNIVTNQPKFKNVGATTTNMRIVFANRPIGD